MRIESVRKLWERLRSSGGRALDGESDSFTSSELAVGRMVLPVLEDLERARRAVDTLTERAQALRVALDILPVAAIVLDDKGRYLTSNGAAQELFGGAAVSGAVVEAAAWAVRSGTEKQSAFVSRVDGSALRVVPAQLEGHAAGDPSVVFLLPQNGAPALATSLLESRYGLTPTQGRVVALVAQGLTNKEAASQLGVSPETVHKHLNAVFQRTGLGTRSAVVALAFGARFGLVPAETA